MQPIKILSSLLLLVMLSCSKENIELQVTDSAKPPSRSTYITYSIRQGQHYSDQNSLKSIRLSEMKFIARFDQSAIYQTLDPNNQFDINKLYGFSEGFNHQYNSARIGWNWYNNALHLHAYVYNRGVRLNREICTVGLNSDINCIISLAGSNYVFAVNGIVVTLSRGATSTSASGYQLYPYFGGDETAPHDIFIKIKNL